MQFRRSRLTCAVLFVLGAVAVVLAANVAIPAERMPYYGTWTGIRPLEQKLDMLSRFAADGPVDALILGSSIADFGFSAEVLSQVMTERQGAPYRAFNFSTGGAEIVTLAKVYRLARTTAVPRTLMLVVPYRRVRPNEFNPRSPDFVMEQAPINRAIVNPWLMPLDKRLWDIPLVRHAAALRDQILYGEFASVTGQGSDLYYMSAFGDTVAYTHEIVDIDIITARADIENRVPLPEPTDSSDLSLEARLKRYFNDVDIDAIYQLKQLSERDGFNVVVVAHGRAVEYYLDPVESPGVRRERRAYTEALAESLGATLVHEIDDFAVPIYAMTDTMHLNHYGAVAFTRQVANVLSGQPSGSAEIAAGLRRPHPHMPDFPSEDPTLNQFSALIEGPPGPERRTLHMQLLINEAIPPLPTGPLLLGVRLPNDSDVVAPAQRVAEDAFEADFPEVPVGSDQILMARLLVEAGGRLVTFNQPMATYVWVDGSRTSTQMTTPH